MRVSLKEYIDRRFADRDHAILVAAENVDRRLADMNELRRQIETERADYVSVESYQQHHASLEAKLAALDDKVGIRVLAIERWQSKLVGALALTTFVLPIMVAVVVYILTRHAVEVRK